MHCTVLVSWSGKFSWNLMELQDIRTFRAASSKLKNRLTLTRSWQDFPLFPICGSRVSLSSQPFLNLTSPLAVMALYDASVNPDKASSLSFPKKYSLREKKAFTRMKCQSKIKIVSFKFWVSQKKENPLWLEVLLEFSICNCQAEVWTQRVWAYSFFLRRPPTHQPHR